MLTVAANVRTRYGEVDLIVRDGKELVFVEVKTRLVDARVGPLDAISPTRALRMRRLAEAYLGEQGDDVPWRIDVVAVHVGSKRQVLHVQHLAHALSE
jgi:putative endonuclease